jgi:hypothetical protein
LDGYLRQGEPQLMDDRGEEMTVLRALLFALPQGFAIEGNALERGVPF